MSIWKFFVAAVDLVCKTLCTLFGLALGVIILLLCADIVLRNLGISSFPWIIEISEYTIYGGTFLAAPRVLQLGRHVQIEILTDAVPRFLARWLDLFANICGLAVSLVMLAFGLAVLIDAYHSGMIEFKNLIIPDWILLLPIPVGSALLAAQFLFRMLGVQSASADMEAHLTQASI
jgi:TRAP-type transport system small permease protein